MGQQPSTSPSLWISRISLQCHQDTNSDPRAMRVTFSSFLLIVCVYHVQCYQDVDFENTANDLMQNRDPTISFLRSLRSRPKIILPLFSSLSHFPWDDLAEAKRHLIPFPRVGKRPSLIPFPRVGKRASLIPFPRVGKRPSLVPSPPDWNRHVDDDVDDDDDSYPPSGLFDTSGRRKRGVTEAVNTAA